MDKPYYDCVIKIILVGDKNVGKYNFIERHVNGSFYDINPISTLNYSCLCKDYIKNNTTIKQQIYNALDHKIFKLNQAYFRKVNVIGLLFSLTDEESFINLDFLLDEINKNIFQSVPIILIGTKADLVNERVISQERIDKFCKIHGLKYIETSAKQNKNITEAFNLMTEEVIK